MVLIRLCHNSCVWVSDGCCSYSVVPHSLQKPLRVVFFAALWPELLQRSLYSLGVCKTLSFPKQLAKQLSADRAVCFR